MKVPAKTAPGIRMRPAAATDVDVRALEHDLRRTIEGEVRFSPGDRALYSATGANYRQLPIGVVIPRSVDDVIATVAACRENGAPLLSRGGGTGLAGQTTNVAVVIDFSKYLNRILEIDPERKLARVEPGLILDHLRKQAEEEHQLTFGPDPSTHEYCTFGGMIASNSCGVRSVMAQFYGPGPRTSDNVHELDVLLYDGRRREVREGTSGDPEIDRRLEDLRDRYADRIRARYPDIPRRVSGYNLDDLLPEKGFHVARALAGTESTCVTYLEATMHLVYSPPCRSLLVLGYDSLGDLGDHIPEIIGAKPMACEGVDRELFRLEQEMHINPDALKTGCDQPLAFTLGRDVLVFGPPKHGKTREVPVPDNIARAIRAHTEQFPPLAVTLPWEHPEGELVTVRSVRRVPVMTIWSVLTVVCGPVVGPAAGAGCAA